MDFIVKNWSLIFIIVLAGCYFIHNGKKSVLEWLFFAVSLAEHDFSESGMGRMKLKSVYDSFIAMYPILSKIIPFSVFSDWVDLALEEMKEAMRENKNFKAYIDELKEGYKD